MTAWERIIAQNHAGCAECGMHTVYWRRYVDAAPPARAWLSVSPPRYSDGAGWLWKYHVAERRHTGATIFATGVEPTVGAAKAAAERAATETSPTGALESLKVEPPRRR